MAEFIDESVLQNFKIRLLMRLNLAQSCIDAVAAELEEMKIFVGALPKDFPLKVEAQKLVNSFDGKLSNGQVEIQNVIQEVDVVTQITWQEMSELQERYLNVFILSNEQPSEIRRQLTELMQRITEQALKKAKAALRKKIPLAPSDPVKEYSTPSIAAMQAAIQKFWLNYHSNSHPQQSPTQKQVSNFIADQLGEPIKNRMTDELARAIKPEGIK
jgi:hypothetical protein